MNKQQLTHWITLLYQTEEVELDCSTLQSLLPTYVETEYAQQELDSLGPAIRAHLGQCSNCQESYCGLKLVVEVEANSEIDDQLKVFG